MTQHSEMRTENKSYKGYWSSWAFLPASLPLPPNPNKAGQSKELYISKGI